MGFLKAAIPYSHSLQALGRLVLPPCSGAVLRLAAWLRRARRCCGRVSAPELLQRPSSIPPASMDPTFVPDVARKL